MLQWTDIVWLALAGACAMLGLLHLYIGLRHRIQRSHLLLAAALFSVGAFAGLELMLMRATSVEGFATAARWLHVPMFTMTVSLVLFMHFSFRLGHWWLGALACLVRGASLVADFTTGVNLNFIEINALEQLPLGFGANISVASGTLNPWMLLGQLGLLLTAAYAVDVGIAAFRLGGGERRDSAVRLSIAVATGYLLGGAAYAYALPVGGIAVATAPLFFGVALALSYELGGEVLRTAHLSDRLNAIRSDLHESEARLDFAQQTVGIGFWSWDFARDRLWLSESARQILGIRSADALDRQDIVARIPAEDRPAVLLALERTRRGGGPLITQCRIRHPAGGQQWLSLSGRMKPESASSGGMHGVLIDVSALHHAADQFRLMFAGSPVAMLMSDVEGRIMLANPQSEALFGYTTDELQKMHIEDLVPQAKRTGHRGLRAAFMGAAAQRRMQPRQEVQGIRKDGSSVPIEVSLNPIQRESSLLVLAAVIDLSERQRLERESALQREELAHLARVAMLSELSGSLAHELNQPLTAVLSNAQAALRFLDHRPPNLVEVREALVNVVDSDKRAGEVIRRLRAMLRKDPPSFILLDINEVVRDVLRIVRSDLLNRHVAIVEDYAADLPLVSGDRVQLQQVLMNLMMNASDAMQGVEGDRQLTLCTLRSEDGVEVRVQDVGTGIPVEDLERIFIPFVSSKKDGMGLGLAVCRTLVEAHRGRLWASNAEGCGAIVHLWLPAGDPA
ncbi:MAG: PAS domain S-box protein [Xanthomonadaceae bacterium]|jgi:PAS domain S-box-containing protein|nr:PAS domain S-box protein [Xanthomonadaceae bacterium]